MESLTKQTPEISPHFRLGQQEDAHEFLHSFLDNMHARCLGRTADDRPASLEEDSIVKQVFGGRLRSQVNSTIPCWSRVAFLGSSSSSYECDVFSLSQLRCCSCGHCSDTFEPLLDLSLEIDNVRSVGDALESFTKLERIDDPEVRFTCDGCKAQVSMEKQLKLDQAPQVLALHLKRFKNDGSYSNKIDDFVEYPLELDLNPCLSCPAKEVCVPPIPRQLHPHQVLIDSCTICAGPVKIRSLCCSGTRWFRTFWPLLLLHPFHSKYMASDRWLAGTVEELTHLPLSAFMIVVPLMTLWWCYLPGGQCFWKRCVRATGLCFLLRKARLIMLVLKLHGGREGTRCAGRNWYFPSICFGTRRKIQCFVFGFCECLQQFKRNPWEKRGCRSMQQCVSSRPGTWWFSRCQEASVPCKNSPEDIQPMARLWVWWWATGCGSLLITHAILVVFSACLYVCILCLLQKTMKTTICFRCTRWSSRPPREPGSPQLQEAWTRNLIDW